MMHNGERSPDTIVKKRIECSSCLQQEHFFGCKFWTLVGVNRTVLLREICDEFVDRCHCNLPVSV